MKATLWTVQVLCGVFFSLTGFGKILWYKPALWNQALQEVPWLSAVPQDMSIFIGVCEFLGGVMRPIAPASISAFRVLEGLAVLGALVLVDFAPVWYRLTHLTN